MTNWQHKIVSRILLKILEMIRLATGVLFLLTRFKICGITFALATESYVGIFPFPSWTHMCCHFTAISDLHGAVFLGRVITARRPVGYRRPIYRSRAAGKAINPHHLISVILAASSDLIDLTCDILIYLGILPEIFLDNLVPGDAATTRSRSWP
jgi:hypothetical protein